MDLNAKEMVKLGNTSLFVATPCFGGQIYQNHYTTMMQVSDLCRQLNIGLELHTLTNMSLIPRARNLLANRFLESSCTHILWVDADVSFESREIINLILADKDIVGGTYPRKRLDWQSIKDAVLRNPDIDAQALPLAGQDHTVFVKSGQQNIDLEQLQQVEWLGTGLMLVKRSVFERLKAGVLADRWYTDMDLPEHPRHWEFFPQGLLKTDDYVGEDYAFCRLCASEGIDLWLAPWMRTQHWGTGVFYGDLRAQAAILGTVKLAATANTRA